MGFSVSGATAVILLGALIAAGTLYGTLDASISRITDANDERLDDLQSYRDAGVRVVDTDCRPSTDSLLVDVRNVGSTQLSVNATDLLVANDLVRTTDGPDADLWIDDRELARPDSGGGFDTRQVGADDTTWFPGEFLNYTLKNSSQPPLTPDVDAYGGERAVVVAPNGVSAAGTVESC